MLCNNDCRIICKEMEIRPQNKNFLQSFSGTNFLSNIKSLRSDKDANKKNTQKTNDLYMENAKL